MNPGVAVSYDLTLVERRVFQNSGSQQGRIEAKEGPAEYVSCPHSSMLAPLLTIDSMSQRLRGCLPYQGIGTHHLGSVILVVEIGQRRGVYRDI